MDRIVLIELLALVVLLNAAVILLVLRSRWVPHAAAVGIGLPEARPGDLGQQDVGSDAGSVAQSMTVLDAVPEEASLSAPEDPRQPIDLVELARRSAVASAAAPDGRWSDADRAAWSDRLRAECARTRRYGRPAAVVALRIDGLDALSVEAGPTVSAWLSGAVARSVRAAARESDVVQADGHASIRVLLVETDEEGARVYVDRVSRPLMFALKDPRAEIRLSAGWAGTSSDADLEEADRLARARLAGISAGWIRSVATWRS